jgi:hypothetical protein
MSGEGERNGDGLLADAEVEAGAGDGALLYVRRSILSDSVCSHLMDTLSQL